MTSKEKKISYDPDWLGKYDSVIATPAQAVTRIKPGSRVFIGTGCAQPQQLVKAMCNRSGDLVDTEIVHLLTFGSAPYAEKQLADNFRVNSFFIAENVRNVIQEGYGDYTPIFLSDIPRLMSSGQLPLDVALIQVTPPDERGMCSLGISVDIVKCATQNAAMVIAEVNSKMPRTLGDSFVHIGDLDVLVPVEEPLEEIQLPQPTDVTRKIGEHVASLVEDGSTVELGIGDVPQAVLEFLKNKKELGIHTEMFTDSIIDVIESGTVTGSNKSTDRGKIVASFCLGTKKLYDYIDNNPLFSFRPTEYVNDPFVIAQNENMVAINSAIEVDLTGQVCADSIGPKFYSGVGGQMDFIYGASRSKGGVPIIALPSTVTLRDGKVLSKIVNMLKQGAGVVTSRNHVRYIITEFGMAALYGKTIRERAKALIGIAHPEFRDELTRQAKELMYI